MSKTKRDVREIIIFYMYFFVGFPLTPHHIYKKYIDWGSRSGNISERRLVGTFKFADFDSFFNEK